ncbi:MAG: hypothetical protein MH112_00030 [Phenylobacterium sp.]|uniref:glycosyltransferase n=1 Tax=Phenylobacterium sp. TaxID=1871053 RepID=UPI0025F428A2|nr:hypothetical protein [Phenylobacterium sp.]MCG9914732.1 hypothetical protein [Phenylobacterium sp.]
MRILLVCGFFETTLNSFRENQFALRLAANGHQVHVLTSTESHVWRYGRARHALTVPNGEEERYANVKGLTISRRKPYIRVGDLVFFNLHRSDFEGVDVVHVLDFRQGVTALAARLAQALNIPVVYDHEQRGNRRGHLLHGADNFIRRSLIRLGATSVTLVRHTVHTNANFLQEVAPSIPVDRYRLSPLGADEAIFYKDDDLRMRRRSELGIAPHERVVAITGRFSNEKRPLDVAVAVADAGNRAIFCGPMSSDVQAALKNYPNVIVIGPATQIDLNAIYNAADLAIFTTFTLSYWEALSSGTPILVPRTSFSDQASANMPGINTFGDESMFSVPEEQYHAHVNISHFILSSLNSFDWRKQEHIGNHVSWTGRIKSLEEHYRDAIRIKRSAG